MNIILGKEPVTDGEKLLYKSLESLPEEWYCYSQPLITNAHDSRNPDFVVIHKNYGITILEVKDWIEIIQINGDEAEIRNARSLENSWQTSPVKQAKQAAYKLVELLIKTYGLGNEKGKLPFPYRFAGILPKIDLGTLKQLRSKWGPNLVFGLLDIEECNIQSLLIDQIEMKFSGVIQERDLEILRSAMDPNIKLPNGKCLDRSQEKLAKAPIVGKTKIENDLTRNQLSLNTQERFELMERTLPAEIMKNAFSDRVRLIRGVGGTGKTDVLLLRCKETYQNEPEKKLLVTTFNEPVYTHRLKPELEEYFPNIEVKRFGQICSDIYFKMFGSYYEPQKTLGVVARLFQEGRDISAFHAQIGEKFIAKEIDWIKELELTTQDKYLSTIREGRGGKDGLRLSRNQKSEMFFFFQMYQSRLSEMGWMDYTDFYHKALHLVKTKSVPPTMYDEILIDEAQHFTPKWIELILLHLSDQGSLFLSEDPNQAVFRNYSWLQKKVDVRGRTSWLKIVYRSTRRIFEGAFSLVKDNTIAIEKLRSAGEEIYPDIEFPGDRIGDLPEINVFQTLTEEKVFIFNKVKEMNNRGYLPSEIAILHPQKYVRDTYSDLATQGVVVDDIGRETGMEFCVVIIPNLYAFCNSDRVGNKYWIEDNQVNLYTAMTRAKDLVFLSHDNRFPKEFEAILDYCQIIHH